MARVGRISVSCDYGDGNPYVIPYRVTEIESAGKTFVGIVSEETGQTGMTWYDDVDLSNTTHLDKVFNLGGTNTYTWLEVMTEVPDDEVAIEYPISIANGGTGATTAAEALANLGAASATALDALTDTVAGKADSSHTHSEYATVAALDALEDAIGDKANASHTHTEYASSSHTHDDRYYTEAEIDSKVSTLESSIASKANSSHTHTIANVTNLQTKLDSIDDAIDGKAAASHTHSDYALTSHNHDGVYAEASHTHNYASSSHSHSVATTAADGFMSAADKIKLSGIATGAEVNQNAFSNVVVGSTTIAADGQTDTLTLVAGSNVTLTPDATNDKITIAATDTVYTHPAYTARTGVPAANQTPGFGDTFNVTQPVSDGSGHITAMNSRTVTIPSTAATTSTAGLMSASDKSKLDGIASGANAYTLPTAGSSLGGVKTTSTISDASGYTACPIISGVPYYKDTNTTYSLSSFGVTATAAELNALDGITATVTELNYCDGVTSNIQTQLNNKASSSHTHSYLPLAGGTVSGNLIVTGTSNLQSDVTLNDRLIFSNSNRGILGTHPTNGNTYHQFQPVNNNGDCAIGYGMYDAGIGSTNIYGQKVTLNSKSRIELNCSAYMPVDKHIYGTDAEGNDKLVFTALSSSGNTAIGYDHYQQSSGSLNLYGNDVKVWSRAAGLSGISYGVNQLLWSGASYMESGKTASLSQNVSAMPHGIVLIFSAYTVGTGAQSSHWHHFFIPKYAVGIDNGGGTSFTLLKGGKMYMKYIYINDSELTGSADNNNSSYSLHGQTVDNRNFVLRYVVGV